VLNDPTSTWTSEYSYTGHTGDKRSFLLPMVGKEKILIMLLIVFAIALFSEQISAQVLYGGLTGTITDQSDAAVPGVKVEITGIGSTPVRDIGRRSSLWR